MSGENELKPCPCGQENPMIDVFQVRKGWQASVRCNGFCGATIHSITYDFKSEAVDSVIIRWNRRSTPPGTEIVPEGTMDALTIAMEHIPGGVHLNSGGRCSSCMSVIAQSTKVLCLKCIRDKITAILTAHRDRKVKPTTEEAV